MKTILWCLFGVVAFVVLGLVFVYSVSWGIPGFVLLVVALALVLAFTPLGDWMDRMTDRSERRG